ncbi:hypothetical protein AKO1_009027 [Acrasis kona]|uniref:YdbS-like PH domain-containing protein n=1 Tax=Acrasis kona TaxID=1008807 RepID=A0AAW2ZID2_9EUKA
MNTLLKEPLRGEVIFQGKPSILGGLIARLKGHKYRITSRNIEIRTGVINGTVDNVELWRIRDVRFLPSVVGGCVNFGTIVIFLDDESYYSEHRLHGIGRNVFEKLENFVREIKTEGENEK